MSLVAVGMRLQGAFFDKAPIIKLMDAKTRRALTRFGVIVQREDKKSLKYGDKASDPGGPPTVHRSEAFTRTKTNRKTGVVKRQASSPLRELIFFAYDVAKKTVVIGPELFRNAKGKDAAKAIEHGGPATIVSDGKLIVATVRARPHTTPAFQRKLHEAPKGYA